MSQSPSLFESAGIRCHACGCPKVWRVSAGLVCDQCDSKIKPIAHVVAESYLPLDWSEVERIPQRFRLHQSRFQSETLAEQNERLARYGERQRPLFDF